jgi:hypothetical protein
MKKIKKVFKTDVSKNYFWWKVVKIIDHIIVIPFIKVYRVTKIYYDKSNEIMDKYNFPPQNPLAVEQGRIFASLNKISTAMRRKHIILTQRNKRNKLGLVTFKPDKIHPIYG